ncbi:hypothetical protein C0J52_21464 [Blattella germanica]|nr:hypothetical protein C0J52_21464 [Blattella germanica]
MCKEHGCSQDSIMELQHVEKSTSSGSQLIIDTKDDESFSNETFNISSFPIDLPVETKMKYVEPIFIVDTHYSVDSNESSIPSVFDILSYNNTCNEEIVRVHKTCIIRKYETAEFETELCKGFVNIIRLAYDYSCFENLPSDEIVNASQEYIEKLSAFIKIPNNSLHREYFQSIANVEKIVEFARATDNQGALQRKLYSLTHIGHDGIQIPPILVPKAYEVQKTYIDTKEKCKELTRGESWSKSDHKVSYSFLKRYLGAYGPCSLPVLRQKVFSPLPDESQLHVADEGTISLALRKSDVSKNVEEHTGEVDYCYMICCITM